MAFKRVEGRPNIQWYPKKASTAFTNGALVYADGSGAIQPADSTSGMHLGVILKSVASTDADYAETTKVPVDVPRPSDVFEADVTGTLTTAMIGNTYDLSTSLVVNVGAQSKNVVTCVGFISSTKGLFSINAMIHVADVATT
jgi:hypothetical protein